MGLARLPLMLPAAAGLVLGIGAGLELLGIPTGMGLDRLPELHAPLMVFGFIATLISLERAVALSRWWAWFAPGLTGLGGLLCVSALPLTTGQLLIVAGMAVHAGQYLAIWRRQAATATAIQALGAACGLMAAIVWSVGVAPARAVPLMAAFLVLTIAGERLELSKIVVDSGERMLMIGASGLAISTGLAIAWPVGGYPLAGAALLLIALWGGLHDVAMRTVRAQAVTRFSSVCMLAGYLWLTVAGAGWLFGGARWEGPVHDAVVHALFVGFAISMIMGHAPLILPAVLGVRITYHPTLYIAVALLHLSLAVRVIPGDAWGWATARTVGAVGTAVAIVIFALTAVLVSARPTPVSKGAERVAS